MQRAHELMAAQLAGASNPSTPLSGPRLAGCCAALRILALLEGMGHTAYVAKFSGPLVKLCYGIARDHAAPSQLVLAPPARTAQCADPKLSEGLNVYSEGPWFRIICCFEIEAGPAGCLFVSPWHE